MDDKNDISSILMLPDNLDLNAIPAFHSRLLELKGGAIRLDAKNVRTLSAQYIQLLLAAKKTWDADNKSFLIEDMSQAFSLSLKQLGCYDKFRID